MSVTAEERKKIEKEIWTDIIAERRAKKAAWRSKPESKAKIKASNDRYYAKLKAAKTKARGDMENGNE